MSEDYQTNSPDVPSRRVDQGTGRSLAVASSASRQAVRRSPIASAHAVAPPQFTPRFFLWVFRRWWKAIVPASLLLASGASAVLIAMHVPQYKAVGLIKIEDTQPYIAFQSGGGGRNDRFINTQIETLRGTKVLRNALGDTQVGAASHLVGVNDRLLEMRKRLKIVPLGKSEFYEVSYTAPTTLEASDVVGAVIREYFKLQSDEEYQRNRRVVELLEQERTRRQLEVERMQARVIDLSKDVTGKDPFANNVVTNVERAANPLTTLHQQLTDLEVRIEILKAELQSIDESPVISADPADRTGEIDLEVAMHPEVRGREQAIKTLDAEMQKVQQVVKQWEQNETYVQLKKDRDTAETELSNLKAQVGQKLRADRQTHRRVDGQSLADVKRSELASLEIQHRAVRKRFDGEISALRESGGKGAELEFAKADLARESKVLEMIASRKLSLQTESKAPARVEVADEVTASSVPLEAIPWKPLIMACGLALVAPFGVATLREATVRRISDAAQLFDETRLRILGEVPSIPSQRVVANSDNLPRRLRRELFAYAESISALRMGLTFAADEQQNVFAVTSAASGEGKTSLAVALAMSFASSSRKPTILIDGDMRKPSVQDFVELREGPGLAEVLAGKAPLELAIQQVPSNPGLFVLRAGVHQGSVQGIAPPDRLERLVSAVRKKFGAVVIDTPPVLGASESLTLCRAADLTMVVALRGVSRVQQIKLCTEKLDSAGAQIAGTVLSGIPSRTYGYAYAYGYGFRGDSRSLDADEEA